MTAGSLVALVIALLPAAIVGTLVGVSARAVGLPGIWGVTLGSAAGSGLVAFESAFAVQLLGGVLDRMEPGAEGIG
jgi:hypothetical protein